MMPSFIFDETTALHPLHIKPNGNQIPATYPLCNLPKYSRKGSDFIKKSQTLNIYS
jgi:hypothetical protein